MQKAAKAAFNYDETLHINAMHAAQITVRWLNHPF